MLCCAKFQLYSLDTFQTNLILQTKPLSSVSISSDFKYMAYGFFELNLFDLENNKHISKNNTLKKSIKCFVFSKSCDSVAVGC